MLTEKQAIAYLTKNGAHLRVPCSRYGYDSESCAQVAYAGRSNLHERKRRGSVDD